MEQEVLRKFHHIWKEGKKMIQKTTEWTINHFSIFHNLQLVMRQSEITNFSKSPENTLCLKNIFKWDNFNTKMTTSVKKSSETIIPRNFFRSDW